MLLTLDVGNTNTVLGLYRPPSDELVTHWRISTLRAQTVDEYGVLLLNLFAMRKIEATEVSSVIIASVVPPLETTLRQVCERYFNVKPMLVEPGIKTGMPILVDNPAELGADRLANGVAAFAKYGGPCVVVDFGTATTFDVITAKGEYVGGVIAPGLAISAEALFSRAARLSRVDVKKPAKVVGTNTIAHMQSGLYYGYIGLVDGILERILNETRGPDPAPGEAPPPLPKIVATGGLARLIVDDSKFIKTIDEMLTLDGLRLIYDRNRVAKVKHGHGEAAGKHA
jgi:type III pantothenate kinase